MANLILAAASPVLIGVLIFVIIAIILGGIAALTIKCLRKVPQGTALIRNGQGGTQVSFTKAYVIPILHIVEMMDISVKRIEIHQACLFRPRQQRS